MVASTVRALRVGARHVYASERRPQASSDAAETARRPRLQPARARRRAYGRSRGDRPLRSPPSPPRPSITSTAAARQSSLPPRAGSESASHVACLPISLPTRCSSGRVKCCHGLLKASDRSIVELPPYGAPCTLRLCCPHYSTVEGVPRWLMASLLRGRYQCATLGGSARRRPSTRAHQGNWQLN